MNQKLPPIVLVIMMALSLPMISCGAPDSALVEEDIPEGNTEVSDVVAEPEDLQDTEPQDDDAIAASVDVNTLEDESPPEPNP